MQINVSTYTGQPFVDFLQIVIKLNFGLLKTNPAGRWERGVNPWDLLTWDANTRMSCPGWGIGLLLFALLQQVSTKRSPKTQKKKRLKSQWSPRLTWSSQLKNFYRMLPIPSWSLRKICCNVVVKKCWRAYPGGYCHIWAIEVYAAVKGMVFKQFTLA